MILLILFLRPILRCYALSAIRSSPSKCHTPTSWYSLYGRAGRSM